VPPATANDIGTRGSPRYAAGRVAFVVMDRVWPSAPEAQANSPKNKVKKYLIECMGGLIRIFRVEVKTLSSG
jgi:hypothetical protein